MSPGTRVLYVGGTCEFCEWAVATYPWASKKNCDLLVLGRAYTVKRFWPAVCDQEPPVPGFAVSTMEVPLPPSWGHCSCAFREIDGDAEEWHRIVRQHAPKELV